MDYSWRARRRSGSQCKHQYGKYVLRSSLRFRFLRPSMVPDCRPAARNDGDTSNIGHHGFADLLAGSEQDVNNLRGLNEARARKAVSESPVLHEPKSLREF